MANLYSTNDVTLGYVEGDDLFYTNMTIQNIYNDDPFGHWINLGNTTLANLVVTNETTLDYAEANSFNVSHVTSENIIVDNMTIQIYA